MMVSNSGLGTTPSFYVEGTWVDFVSSLMTTCKSSYVMRGMFPNMISSLGSTGDIGFQGPRGRPDDDTKSIYPTAAGVSDV